MTFEELGLHDTLLEAIGYMGFKDATPIQEQAIPPILEGQDIIASAQTGTGKTAAFILPILHKLITNPPKGTDTLVLCPTRELAIQIEQQIRGFTYFTDINSIAIYGGGDGDNWDVQKASLSGGANIIVATPGKFISHMNLDNVDFSQMKHVILDEADRMLDIGFYDDIIKIFAKIPKDRQTLMFSATMPPKIRKLSKQILTDPFEVSIAISKPAEGVLQAAYLVYNGQKTRLIDMLIADKPSYKSILIFSSTKRDVSEIVRALKKRGYPVQGISSDLEQSEREQVLRDFRSKKTRVLVATDVLSRGIDIKDIELVINYAVPMDAEDYVHRIGRTARAATTGVALTLVNEDDMQRFSRIEQLIEKEVPKVKLPDELGEGPAWNPKYRPKGKSGGGHGGRSGGKPRHGGNKGGKKPYRKGPPRKND